MVAYLGQVYGVGVLFRRYMGSVCYLGQVYGVGVLFRTGILGQVYGVGVLWYFALFR